MYKLDCGGRAGAAASSSLGEFNARAERSGWARSAAQAGRPREPPSQGTRCPGPLGVRLLFRAERGASFSLVTSCLLLVTP